MNLVITDTDYLRPALDRFFKDKHALMNAFQYVGERNADARRLIADLEWKTYLHGAMVGTLKSMPREMRYSIHLAMREGGIRPGAPAGTGDFYRPDVSAPLLFEDIVQPIAFILATNW